MKLAHTSLLLALSLCFYPSAYAANDAPVKVGAIISLSGPFVEDGIQKKQGIELYLSEHNNMLGGRPAQVIFKDDAGVNPALVKRQATDLVLKDKVDVIGGFTVTGNLLAAAPVSTESKVPIISMVPDFPHVLESAPYVIRTSEDLIRSPMAMAAWAHDNNIKKVYTLVSDFSVGHDVEEEFVKEFKRMGGTIAGSARVPLSAIDYSPYLQRVKESGVDALFTMVANGQPSVSLFKGIQDRGLKEAGIRIIATGGVTGEHALGAIGSAAIGTITSFNYAEAHDSPENKKFVAAFKQKYPDSRPSYIAVAAYDGMYLIDKALEKSGGKSDADSFLAAAGGMAWESPRGPVKIDPATRNMLQQEYYREVKEVDGLLQNVEFGEPIPPQP